MTQNLHSPEEGISILLNDVKSLYRKLDEYAINYVKDFNVSCIKGCDHCCYLLTTVSFAEGLLIAEKILHNPELETILIRLHKAAKRYDVDGLTRVNYFDKGYPCVFLGDNHLCEVYEERPAACRYHYVTSNPENCSFKAPITTTTQIVNLIDTEEKVWKLSIDALKHMGHPAMIAGTPLMVLTGLKILTLLTNHPTHKFVCDICDTLRPPSLWLEDCYAGLLRD